MESLCLLERPLPNGSVNYEEHKVWGHYFVHLRHFLQQPLFFLVPSGGVYDYDIKVLIFEMSKAVLGYCYCVFVFLLAIHFDVYLAAIHL